MMLLLYHAFVEKSNRFSQSSGGQAPVLKILNSIDKSENICYSKCVEGKSIN